MARTLTRSKKDTVTHADDVAALVVSMPRKSRSEVSKKSSPDAPLTDQQKLFVQYWAGGDSVGAAALRAGFSSPSYGYQIRYSPKIVNLYETLKAEYRVAAQLSKEDVINGLKEAINDAKLMSEPATQIAGWREIGKLCGFYEAKKIDVNVNVQGAVMLDRMNKMSDSELLNIINEASALGVEQETLLDHDDDEDEISSSS